MKRVFCLIMCCYLTILPLSISSFANSNQPNYTISCSDLVEGKVTVTVSVDKSAMEYPEGNTATAYFRIDFGEYAKYFTADGVINTGFPPTYTGIVVNGGGVAATDYTYNGESFRRYTISSMTADVATLSETFTVSPDIPDGKYTVSVLPSAFYQENSSMYTENDDSADAYFVTQSSGFPPQSTYYKTASIVPATLTIGNTSASDDPTQLDVGEGKAITNNTANAATVTGTVSDGTATLNVACDKACVVAYTTDEGKTYTRVNATKADSGYDFVVPDYSENMKFVVAVKGDVNGDGILDSTDTGQVKAVQLGKIKTFTALQTLAADLDGNGTIESTEAGQIKAAQLGKIQLVW